MFVSKSKYQEEVFRREVWETRALKYCEERDAALAELAELRAKRAKSNANLRNSGKKV